MRHILELKHGQTKELKESFEALLQAPVEVAIKGALLGYLIRLKDIAFQFFSLDGELRISRIGKIASETVFCFLKSGSACISYGDEVTGIEQEQVVSFTQAGEISFHGPSECMIVSVRNELLLQRLSAFLDKPVQKTVAFETAPLSIHTRHGAGIRGLRGLQDGIEALAGSPLLLRGSREDLRHSSIEHLMVDSLLLTYPNNFSDLLDVPMPSVAPRHVKRALDHIHANPSCHMSPEALASLAGVSVRSLQYAFVDVTGQTITDYQRGIRLREACKLVISKPDLPLGEIARIWGFGSLASFGQSFKKAYGMSPSQLRRGYKGDAEQDQKRSQEHD